MLVRVQPFLSLVLWSVVSYNRISRPRGSNRFRQRSSKPHYAGASPAGGILKDVMDNAAIELDKWIRFAGCDHLGYIATAVGADDLIVYWDKTCGVPGGMPETFRDLPMKLKRIDRLVPATS